MQLKLINATNCPNCLAETVSESCRSFHCNGEGFEERQFACGCVLAWSPNFSRLETKIKCSRHPDEIEKNNKRKRATNAVLEYIKLLDVDDDWKKSKSLYII